MGSGKPAGFGPCREISAAKNHEFLIDIFAAVAERIPDALLVLVGAGTGLEAIREKVRRLGLAGRVIFTGVRSDVNRLMQAMDVFVFPSLYEGLPVTMIEAQAAGLPLRDFRPGSYGMHCHGGACVGQTIVGHAARMDKVHFEQRRDSPDRSDGGDPGERLRRGGGCKMAGGFLH